MFPVILGGLGGRMTFDAGPVLLREVDKAIGLTKKPAGLHARVAGHGRGSHRHSPSPFRGLPSIQHVPRWRGVAGNAGTGFLHSAGAAQCGCDRGREVPYVAGTNFAFGALKSLA